MSHCIHSEVIRDNCGVTVCPDCGEVWVRTIPSKRSSEPTSPIPILSVEVFVFGDVEAVTLGDAVPPVLH